MKINLTQKPQHVTLIQGFAGFGLIGAITTEFLLEHLEVTQIGSIIHTQSQPAVAIHSGRVIDPIGIYYNSTYNTVIIHVYAGLGGAEWEFADTISQIAQELTAECIISIEGVFDPNTQLDSQVFTFTQSSKHLQTLAQMGAKPLSEGIVMGVAGALLCKQELSSQLLSLFATTHSQLPDSNAAAKIIQFLDKLLNINVDPQPLVQKAQALEEKYKQLIQNAAQTSEEQEKKQSLTYVV